MMQFFLLVGGFLAFAQAKTFRYDYEFSAEAGGWLKYHEIPAVWQEARMRCHAEGSILASPMTNSLKAGIFNFVKKEKAARNSIAIKIFSGVHSTFSKGDYTSVDGVPLLKMAIKWAPGEPDNFNNSESCLVMMTDTGDMADANCNDVFPYVCYKKDAYFKINQCGTSDPEYTLEPKTGSCYKFHRRGLAWSEAYKTCVAEGAYLAIVNSAKEAELINGIFHRHDGKTIRSPDPYALGIGFRDWGIHHDFLTVNGKTLEDTGFALWYNQPDNSTRERTKDVGEFCGTFLLNARLNDFWCNVPVPFLCEKDPNSLL